jgi:hypothetical protein
LPAWKRDYQPWDLLLGRLSPRLMWTTGFSNSYATVAGLADKRLPRRAKILLVAETRGMYWPRRVIHHSPHDLQTIEEILRTSAGATEAAKRLRQRASHLYVNDEETARIKLTRHYYLVILNEREESLAAELWKRWMDEEVRDGTAVIYRIRSSPRPPGSPAPALPLTFNNKEFRRKYESWVMMTWEGDTKGKQSVKSAW